MRQHPTGRKAKAWLVSALASPPPPPQPVVPADGGKAYGNAEKTVPVKKPLMVLATLPRVLARWDEVLELARSARAPNEINGKLILERMAHNQAALSVLLAAADQAPLYDADGHTRTVGGGRILGSA